MLALQASIGALNDIIDAPVDRGRKPGKPIPAGIVPVALARLVVVVGAVSGCVLAAPSGWLTAGLAVLTLAIGYGYDLRAKGTAWSWLPFAIGIPLLPVFAWVGATGRLPSGFALLLPAAVASGAALAIANARADLDRDTASGVDSVAVRLGAGASWAVHAVVLGAVILVAIGSLAARGVTASDLALAVAAALVIGLGVVVSYADTPARRERGWELEAIGVALLAVAWLARYGDLG
jgi:4-hydroxybenzoate polyprenyltransferase